MKRLSALTATLALATAAIFSPSARAQEVAPPALDPGFMAGWTANAAVQYDLERRANEAAGKGKGRTPSNRQTSAAQKGAVRLTYTSTAAIKQQALDAYVARLATRNPDTARLMAEQFKKHDAGAIYHSLVADTGLRDNDVADNLTAYTILGWMIATGSNEPSPTSVRAARNQVAGVMASDDRFANPSLRARFGEELKLLFVTVHAGWQSAKREGNVQQYSDGIAKIFGQQSRETLQSLELTSAGFVRR